jgi:hypothetical protein
MEDVVRREDVEKGGVREHAGGGDPFRHDAEPPSAEDAEQEAIP